MLAAGLLLAVLGCGGGGFGEFPDGGNGNNADAATSGCSMVATFSPAAPVTGQTVRAAGAIEASGLFGLERYDWAVTREGAEVPFLLSDPDGRTIDFVVDRAGVYDVELGGALDDNDCFAYQAKVNVLDPGVELTHYRLRAVPLPDQPAPPQELAIAVPPGTDYDLGTLSLSAGSERIAQITDAAGAPLAAYVRATPVGVTAAPTEAFAGADGAIRVRLLPVSYDLLIVPIVATAAPLRLAGVDPETIGGPIAVPDGVVVAGFLFAPDGSGLTGARVGLAIDGVPSTLAVTGADGSFQVRVQAAGPAALSVSPPAGSGLPQLDVDAAAGLVAGAGQPIEIHYDPVAGVAATLAIRGRDGVTAAAGARVTLRAVALPAAGSVNPGTGTGAIPAAASLQVSAVAGDNGDAGPFFVPAGSYLALVEPPPAAAAAGEAPLLATLDLTAGAQAPLTLAEPAQVTGRVARAAGGPLAGAIVTALPRGLLAVSAGGAVTAVAGADGGFSLPLAGGGDYTVQVRPPPGVAAAWASFPLQAPAAGASVPLGDVTLARAADVSARLAIPGIAGGPAGVHVALLCDGCEPAASVQPLAEAVSSAGGRVLLQIGE